MDHIWGGSTTGNLIKTSMEYMKLELVVQGSIFKLDYEIYGYLATDCWVKHMWEFVDENAIEIDDVVAEGTMLRGNDSMLTGKFVCAAKKNIIFSGDWETANRCKLYTKALIIVDIATENGQTIDVDARKDIRQEGRARDIDWHIQGIPSKKDWGVWRQVLRVSLCRNKQLNLVENLGIWLHESADKALHN